MMPAIYGTEMGSLIQGQIGAWWSISTTFMYILKFQNKMYKRVSCSIGCFVTDFFFFNYQAVSWMIQKIYWSPMILPQD